MEREKDLIYWVPSFYVMEDLLMRFSPLEASHARLRLKNDICEARQNYNRVLANLLFDVIVKMCFGEARHAHDRCGIIIPEISQSMDRKAIYAFAEQFDPKASLPKLRDLFLECWLQPYGGSTWAIIVETAIKYWSLPPEIFVDHCVDLSHHGGLAFDKPESGVHVWHKRKYMDILDCKRNGSILDIDNTLPVFHFVRTMLERANNLKIIDMMPELVVSEKYSYRPVKWGHKILREPLSIECINRPEAMETEKVPAKAAEEKPLSRCHWGSKLAFQWQNLIFFGAGSFRGLDSTGMDVFIDCGADIQQNTGLINIPPCSFPSQRDRIIEINWLDGGEPSLTEKNWRDLLKNLERIRLRAGKNILNILVCCQGGHGRTGTALSILAALTGVAAGDPVKFIRENYCQKAVETMSQCAYIKKITKLAADSEPSLPEADTSCESFFR